MFNEINNVPQGQAKEVDDIFSDVDAGSETKPPVANPLGVAPASAITNMPNQAMAQKEIDLEGDDSGPVRKTKVIRGFVILLLVLVVLGCLAYFVYDKFLTPKMEFSNLVNDSTNTSKNVNQSVERAPSAEEITELIKQKEQDAVNQLNASSSPNDNIEAMLASNTSTSTIPTSTVEVSSLDSDSDGLTDTEEATYGTNPLNADSDADELIDYDEIKTYRTNPLSKDTDGDGYLDGAEVKSGYNPNGAGKLIK